MYYYKVIIMEQPRNLCNYIGEECKVDLLNFYSNLISTFSIANSHPYVGLYRDKTHKYIKFKKMRKKRNVLHIQKHIPNSEQMQKQKCCKYKNTKHKRKRKEIFSYRKCSVTVGGVLIRNNQRFHEVNE